MERPRIDKLVSRHEVEHMIGAQVSALNDKLDHLISVIDDIEQLTGETLDKIEVILASMH